MPSVLIIDDEVAITTALGNFFERSGGHTVYRAHTGQEGIDLFLRTHPDLILLDLRLPDMSGFEVLEKIRAGSAGGTGRSDVQPVVIMITAHGDVPLAVQALQAGAENFLTKPVELPHLKLAAERAFEKGRLRQMTRYLTSRREGAATSVLLGMSALMRDLAEQVELLSASDKTTVLLLGESGTGKGRVAEAIHALSPRRDRAFVEVNCAALTAGTLDGELFGEETEERGERRLRKRGLFEVADGGTLFLDEIGDLGPELQPKLLRVLEGKSFRRLGGTQEVSTNVRLIAATSKDLVNEVTAGTFREDLYYRLSVMPVSLPPLRARAREDLLELIRTLVASLHPQMPDSPLTISEGALDRLLRYSWPGNIRELRNVLERAMIVARGSDEVRPQHLPPEVRDASGVGVGGGGGEHHVPRSLDEVERVHIERTLRAHNANRTRAALELGISRATLVKKIKQYGLRSGVEERTVTESGGRQR